MERYWAIDYGSMVQHDANTKNKYYKMKIKSIFKQAPALASIFSLFRPSLTQSQILKIVYFIGPFFGIKV